MAAREISRIRAFRACRDLVAKSPQVYRIKYDLSNGFSFTLESFVNDGWWPVLVSKSWPTFQIPEL